MKSLKVKLIIQIITFILIFGDAYMLLYDPYAGDDNAGNFKIYIYCKIIKIILAMYFSQN